MTAQPDIIIRGGGVAGCASAILLARAGCRVTQLVDPRSRTAPPEILSPWSRTLLDQMRIPQPLEAANCGGVLSRWGGNEPEFHDYLLTTARQGLAVNRDSFHRELANTAFAAGVKQITLRTCNDHYTDLEMLAGAYHLYAGGRSAPGRRKSEDRLVAMYMPCVANLGGDQLIIEAASEGWWYLPPAVGSTRFVVFVTDQDAIPKNREIRATWLRESLGNTDLIGSAASRVYPKQMAGMDARVATTNELTWAIGARLGDAAISLDPLSGTGVARALEGASVVTRDILENGHAGEPYRAWVEDTHAEELIVRASIYQRAADRFPRAPFWRRRMIRIGEQLREYAFP